MKFAEVQVLCIREFLRKGIEAKNARESSQRLFLKGTRSEHIKSSRVTRASNIYKRLIILKLFRDQKSDIFARRYSKSFFGIVLPTQARSTFFKKMIRKVS